MDNNLQSELLYKNNQLEREVASLKDQVEQLTEANAKASAEVERLENILSLVPKEALPHGTNFDISGRSLRFKMATVMYVDIRGFRNISHEIRPSSAIDELDQIFIQFDEICNHYNLQIVKTIGDTYMCAGGIPEKNITNPIDVVVAAMEMLRLMRKMKADYEKQNLKFWDVRIGIHTGPVIAVPSGKKKISYDLKGETVNIANRMASAADFDKINVSAYTYEFVRDYFVTDYNGVSPVKYQGNLEMYYIRRLRPALSVNRSIGEYPNEIFWVKYALRQFTDLQEYMLDKLEKELPSFLHYHNFKHTIDVVNQAELIGLGEGVDDEAILLLKTAALFHDSGHIVGYENHEYYGTQIAREILPKWKYTPEHIEKICSLIMATKLPPNPQNLLEKVMCDADLDYLGRSDFIPISNSLYDELIDQGKNIDLFSWNKNQVKFLTNHQYFTNTALRLREVGKEYQIERLKGLIEQEEASEAKQ
ncbi:MAG: HD domain-containing protein [Bacteroidales bacterium]|nr:HD domain-containing protein [Bacteroidales bacterium]